jgi:hypothetical protein
MDDPLLRLHKFVALPRMKQSISDMYKPIASNVPKLNNDHDCAKHKRHSGNKLQDLLYTRFVSLLSTTQSGFYGVICCCSAATTCCDVGPDLGF